MRQSPPASGEPKSSKPGSDAPQTCSAPDAIRSRTGYEAKLLTLPASCLIACFPKKPLSSPKIPNQGKNFFQLASQANPTTDYAFYILCVFLP